MKITLVLGTAFSYEEETPQNSTSKQISGFLIFFLPCRKRSTWQGGSTEPSFLLSVQLLMALSSPPCCQNRAPDSTQVWRPHSQQKRAKVRSKRHLPLSQPPSQASLTKGPLIKPRCLNLCGKLRSSRGQTQYKIQFYQEVPNWHLPWALAIYLYKD